MLKGLNVTLYGWIKKYINDKYNAIILNGTAPVCKTTPASLLHRCTLSLKGVIIKPQEKSAKTSRFCLTSIRHQMLLTLSLTAFSTYLCSSETSSGFRPPLATLLFYLSLKVLVSPALCQIDCGLSSLLMLQCEENTPSPGSLAASPRLWLAAIKSKWHHPFFF